jgi:hypothetical protein
MSMNRDEAVRALEERKRKLQSRIPASAPLLRARYLRNVVDDEVEAARKHLQALYESGLEVGSDFAALQAHAAHPKYAFWLEGIHRHLQSCEAVLAEQPAGA